LVQHLVSPQHLPAVACGAAAPRPPTNVMARTIAVNNTDFMGITFPMRGYTTTSANHAKLKIQTRLDLSERRTARRATLLGRWTGRRTFIRNRKRGSQLRRLRKNCKSRKQRNRRDSRIKNRYLRNQRINRPRRFDDASPRIRVRIARRRMTTTRPRLLDAARPPIRTRNIRVTPRRPRQQRQANQQQNDRAGSHKHSTVHPPIYHKLRPPGISTRSPQIIALALFTAEAPRAQRKKKDENRRRTQIKREFDLICVHLRPSAVSISSLAPLRCERFPLPSGKIGAPSAAKIHSAFYS
jgi:hypothetical protein